MKKHLSIGLSAFALAALLSGCAGGSGHVADVGGRHDAARQRRGDLGSGVDPSTVPRPPRTSRSRIPAPAGLWSTARA